ncbi:hypothetical protein F2Q68_00027956 [Brassica cretica]|uniref:Protein kinase domain-containing protein n=1 Tax=Brassica cretica TaxID=69181 RepID=A0A8S9IH88_BRACR|nr:hypothetical protein F2Q68_00027956 [Brassica cretica]
MNMNNWFDRVKEDRENLSFSKTFAYADLSSECMRTFPFDFIKSLPIEELSNKMVIIAKWGSSWEVDISKNPRLYYMEKSGWNQFVRDNALGKNEFVTFTHIGSMCFDVNIYGKDEKEIVRAPTMASSSGIKQEQGASMEGVELEATEKKAEESKKKIKIKKVVNSVEIGESSRVKRGRVRVKNGVPEFEITIKRSGLGHVTSEFWHEAEILSKLHHPNVMAFYGVVKDGPGGTLATVTEYMVNGSLRHVLLSNRHIDRRKRLIIAMDAAFGMEYLHSKNIVHFDLKCDNLLVNLKDPARPICKVGDFGLSKIKRNTLVSGGVRGTLPWMAPELLSGSSSKVSEKVDVFSFGIVLWEILTGEEPYANMHYGAIIGGIVNNTLRPTVPSYCDPEWRMLMEQCWAPDPFFRPSFPEIARRLRTMSSSVVQTKAHSPNHHKDDSFKVVMALKCRGEYLMDGAYTRINTRQIMATSQMVQEYTGLYVQPHKPIVGASCFVHESGIHQDGILKNRSTYEILSPEDVGVVISQSSSIVLGKLSGRHAVKDRLKELGYELDDDKLNDIFSKFRDLTKHKKRITDDDLKALVTGGDEISSLNGANK